MINLAATHEDNIIRFQRKQYIISFSPLQNKSSIGHEDIQRNEHISLEAVREMFPSITTEAIVRILLVTIQMKLKEGQRRFLLTYTDETKRESLDLMNGLVSVLQIKASAEEQQQIFESLHMYAGEWTKEICRAESHFHNIENTLSDLRKLS
ncbi:hypothetical protein IEO70_03850 [Bacillus sp. AGMB 02131]|uniref:Uncharacterized protein n=1 Tax=Peribacillus faecalis TaxID=2772559 RepID=A0A927CY60_9BACI|nr:hypothetical protein [Peribacillus faecalis]MBD3107489.1 hypothetical protein [Peribacillus faecalis]